MLNAMRLAGTVGLIGVGALAIAGCAHDPATASAAPAPGVPLEEANFVVDTIDGVAPPKDVKVSISFSPGDHDTSRVSGSAGCNRFTGGYTQSPTAMKFSPLATTMMMCEPKAMDTERKFLAFMADVTSFRLDKSGVLTLTTADKRVLRAHKG